MEFGPQAQTRREDAPPGLFLDAGGRWYHDGDWVRHERLSALLTRSISRDETGGLIVTTGRDVLPFQAEGAPLIVRTMESVCDTVAFVLSDETREKLDAETKLVVDTNDRFFLAVKQGEFWARLSRTASQGIAAVLEETAAGIGVVVGPFVVDVGGVEGEDWTQRPSC